MGAARSQKLQTRDPFAFSGEGVADTSDKKLLSPLQMELNPVCEFPRSNNAQTGPRRVHNLAGDGAFRLAENGYGGGGWPDRQPPFSPIAAAGLPPFGSRVVRRFFRYAERAGNL